jgi:hypothetical protein
VIEPWVHGACVQYCNFLSGVELIEKMCNCSDLLPTGLQILINLEVTERHGGAIGLADYCDW